MLKLRRSRESLRSRSNKSGLVFALPLVVLWLTPLLGFAALFPTAQQVESETLRLADPVTSIVGARLDDSLQAVDITAQLPAPPKVLTRASGIVTSVEISPGAELHSGTPLMRVDGVLVLAYAGPAPFYRDLQRGAKGEDVDNLTQLLVSLGFLNPSSQGSQYNRAVSGAVEALQQSLGASVDGVFKLSYVAYIPSDPLVVSTVDVLVDDVVTSGDAILSAITAPSSLAFAITGSPDKRPTLPPGPILLTIGDEGIELESLEITIEQRTQIYAVLEAATGSGTALTVDRSEDGSRAVFSGAFLSAAQPVEVGVVPSSALFLAEDSTTCLFVDRSTSEKSAYEAILVNDSQLLVGELGQVTVPKALKGEIVVRNPLSLPQGTLNQCK